MADVLKLLETAGSDVLMQKPSLARARTLAYLAGVCLKALEVGELESRMEALENRTPIERRAGAMSDAELIRKATEAVDRIRGAEA